MKRKVIIASICIFVLAITIGTILLISSISVANDTDYITINNISLVYRYGNYAYDLKDELYTIERDGTIRCHNMRDENKNSSLISIVVALLQDSDSIVGASDAIPENIIEEVKAQNLSELKYNSELGEFDAPNTVYYVLVETNTSIELINIASYSGNNKLSDFKLREETVEYINDVIKSVK